MNALQATQNTAEQNAREVLIGIRCAIGRKAIGAGAKEQEVAAYVVRHLTAHGINPQHAAADAYVVFEGEGFKQGATLAWGGYIKIMAKLDAGAHAFRTLLEYINSAAWDAANTERLEEEKRGHNKKEAIRNAWWMAVGSGASVYVDENWSPKPMATEEELSAMFLEADAKLHEIEVRNLTKKRDDIAFFRVASRFMRSGYDRETATAASYLSI
jgi:hypothetical protein